MRERTKRTRHWIVAGLLPCLGACQGPEEPDVEFSSDLNRVHVESLDELATRSEIPSEPGRYLVEGDIAVDYAGLVNYYERRNFADKAIVTTVVNNATGQVFDATRTGPMNIRYCLTGGWGGTEAVKANVVSTLASATRAWSAVARVKFVYSSGLDGAGCTQALVPGSVDFIVKPNVGSANSSYAWWAYAQVEEMAVGQNMTYVSAMLHELGHVLGLDHEQFHDSSGLGCTPPSYTPPAGNFSWGNQRELTTYDNQSIMHYYSGGVAACGGGTPTTRLLSARDGVGMRLLYGNPLWWYGGTFSANL